MRLITWLIISFFPIFCLGQIALDKEVYLDSLKLEAKSDEYVYLRIIKNYHTIQNEYLVTDFYKSGQIEMSGKSTSRDNINKKGVFTYYFEDGNRREVVNYQNTIKVGSYLTWYGNGKQKIAGEYLKNEKTNETEGILKINQSWTIEGVQQVIDGNGIHDDIEDENVNSHGLIKDGLKEGDWVGENKNLETTFTEEYSKGKLIFGTSTDAKGTSFYYKALSIEPRPTSYLSEIRNKIFKSVKFNMNSPYAGKRVILFFFVEKDGQIRAAKTREGISPKIDAQAVALLLETPKWHPALRRGVPERKLYYFQISMPTIFKI